MIVVSALTSVLFFLVIVSQSHAYIDMGTGSYLMQIVLAFILTAGVGIKIFWQKIKTFFMRAGKSLRDNSTEKNDDV